MPRIIPVLLLSGDRLVKTLKFGSRAYVGDPLNVINIFNEFEVDEIVLVDIDQSRNRLGAEHRDYLHKVVSECLVPLAYGGGIRSADEAEQIVSAGVEKVILNSLVLEDPTEVREAVRRLGSQAVVAALDVKAGAAGDYEIWTRGGSQRHPMTVQGWCDLVSFLEVGEVFVTNIDREGTRQGYDLDLIKQVVSLVKVPVIAHGGAGDREDLRKPVVNSGASAVAAGSLFLFQGDRRSVLVNYPSREDLSLLFNDADWGPSALLPETQLLTPMFDGSEVAQISSTEMCSRCVITIDVPGADFDSEGICQYCRIHDDLNSQYELGPAGDAALADFVDRLKREGRGKQYDCVIGVSGGTDSSFLAHLLARKGVRMLAVHFDNTWNSPTATSNIYAVLGKLNIDLETYVVDNEEYDDLYLAFLKAGVKDIEAPTDIGFMATLYRAAKKHEIKNIVEGHSFRTEGISPLGWLYMDGGYIRDVHRKFGQISMRSYPNMSFFQFIWWSLFSGIKRTRPLYWVDYNKEKAKELLADEYGWRWYGGHHLENRFTAFYHSHFLPKRFGINFRQIEFSALVRSGQKERAVAVRELAVERTGEVELIELVKKRLGLSDSQFEGLMSLPQKSHLDFATYKRLFESLRPLFWVLLKLNRVPESFYLKFCKKWDT